MAFDPDKTDYQKGDLIRVALTERVETGPPNSTEVDATADDPKLVFFEITDPSVFYGTGVPFGTVHASGCTLVDPTLVAERFLLEDGLYKSIDTDDFLASFAMIKTMDAYCPVCGRPGVFSQRSAGQLRVGTTYLNAVISNASPFLQSEVNPFRQRTAELLKQGAIAEICFACARGSEHKLSYFIEIRGENLRKVGQIPTIADVAFPELKKYRKLLGNDQYRELTTGVGLFAHGVGIGSFVYLRRIIERLIGEAAAAAVKQGVDATGLTEHPFDRMPDRIKKLKGYLPPFLVEKAKLYGILSDGIHNLSEDKCLSAFPAVKLAIEMILDEKLVELEKQNKRREAGALLDKLGNETN